MKQLFFSLAGLALVGGLLAVQVAGQSTPPRQTPPQLVPPMIEHTCTVEGQPVPLLDGAGGKVLFYSIACDTGDVCKVSVGTQGLAQTCAFAPTAVPPTGPSASTP